MKWIRLEEIRGKWKFCCGWCGYGTIVPDRSNLPKHCGVCGQMDEDWYKKNIREYWAMVEKAQMWKDWKKIVRKTGVL